jgi:hypothetical protein
MILSKQLWLQPLNRQLHLSLLVGGLNNPLQTVLVVSTRGFSCDLS